MGTFIISYPNCGNKIEILQKGGIFAKGARITPLSPTLLFCQYQTNQVLHFKSAAMDFKFKARNL